METVTVREVRLNFRRVLGKHHPVLVTRTGKPVAAVVPLHSEAEVEDFSSWRTALGSVGS